MAMLEQLNPPLEKYEFRNLRLGEMFCSYLERSLPD